MPSPVRRVEGAILGIWLVAACAIPGTLAAQRVISTLDGQGIWLRYADSVEATATGLSPTLRIDWDRATVRASGTYAKFAQAWSADGSLDASVFSPSVGPFSAALAGTLGGSTHQDGTRTGTAIGLGRLHIDERALGGWLGAGGGVTSDGFASHRVREGEAGVWWAGGGAGVTLAAAPTAIDDSIRYTDLTVEGNWRGGTFEFGAVAGARAGSRLPLVGSSATGWGSVSGVAWLLPRLALLASAGTYPVDFTQSYPGGRFVSAGIRLALSPRNRPSSSRLDNGSGVASGDVIDVQIASAVGGGKTLRVRAPSARTVEINGDFTGWSPRAMTAEPDGWFAFTAPLGHGTYQLAVRVNGGEWMPPPSLPTVSDEFGGVVGVLVVP